MIYSITKVTNVADCNSLIASAELERDEISFRKQQHERQYKSINNGTVGVDVELTAVSAEIDSLEGTIATMDEGPGKKLLNARLTKLNFKKFTLIERRDKYGIFALLEKECEINRTEQELVVSTAYIAALEARTLEL
jgi:hypothetical protein